MRLLICYLAACALSLAQGPGWWSAREYENVRVRFEYKLAQWAEAAVVFRTPQVGRPIQQGVAVFLAHDFHQKPGLYTTGALAGKVPPLRLLPPSYEVWHQVEITLDGEELNVSHDGELLQMARVGPESLGKGFLHFAALEHKYSIRNWTVEELPVRQSYIETWAPFQLRGNGGEWQLGKDSLRGANGHGIQYAAPQLADFVFSAEVKSTNRANGGIFFRGSADEKKPRGFEVQIYSPLDAVFPTGSIYGQVRSTVASETENRWFHLRVLVQGSRCVVWVDGVLVAESDLIEETQGQIGFQIHMENTAVEWRNIRAVRLKAEP